MGFTRREFLRGGGALGAAAMLSSCAAAQGLGFRGEWSGPWPVAGDGLWAMLSRLTFGPRGEERVYAAEVGGDAWIEEQLAPDGVPDAEVGLRLQGFDSVTMDSSIIFDVGEDVVVRELQQAALVRAVYSRRQLYELMVDFWGDHFSISTRKGACAWLKPIDDREVLRPYALGSFRDLLWAAMHSPAMLVYLDNQQNFAVSPNENYARELMELHTLGVDAGYTQSDVREVARCLTGWSVDDGLFEGQFQFVPEVHDDGVKRVLGQVIPAGGGERDGERVFEVLLAHPALPQFIARKLVRRFVADDAPVALVEAAAATFRRTRGDMKAVLGTILHGVNFAAVGPKFKRPLHFVAGALRQLEAASDGGQPLLEALAQMGQPLFQWPTPDGFPDRTAAWTGALLARWQFALRLVRGEIAGTQVDVERLAQVAGARSLGEAIAQVGTLLMGAPLPGAQALVGQVGEGLDRSGLQVAVAALLAAPQYQWR